MPPVLERTFTRPGWRAVAFQKYLQQAQVGVTQAEMGERMLGGTRSQPAIGRLCSRQLDARLPGNWTLVQLTKSVNRC